MQPSKYLTFTILKRTGDFQAVTQALIRTFEQHQGKVTLAQLHTVIKDMGWTVKAYNKVFKQHRIEVQHADQLFSIKELHAEWMRCFSK